jgi:hypothetical protein
MWKGCVQLARYDEYAHEWMSTLRVYDGRQAIVMATVTVAATNAKDRGKMRNVRRMQNDRM